MAQMFTSPAFQFVDSSGRPYAGGSLTFYQSGTTTPLATYSDANLSVANTNPVVLNSAGWPDTAIFLQNLPYKVVLKDSDGNQIWTRDPVSTTDFQSVAVTKTGSGSPTGSVAGTAGSSGVLPTVYWDYTNQILYVCTTTGTASTAVWTAVNAAAPTPTVVAPQGYLTLTSGTPVIASDVTAATAVYYTPFVGNLVPIYNGSRMVPTEITELTLTLVSSHVASTIYDAFVFSNSGVPTLVTGPAWDTSTAGSGARGTGASTTELTRLNGYWVNKVQMTARNGSTTYTVAANLATYVGSIFMDGTNGEVSCHLSWGQSRKWGVWNAYNRQPLLLQAGDSTTDWTYSTNTVRASNNDSDNSLTVFAGMAEEFFDLKFDQRIGVTANNATGTSVNGIGWNSTTAISGKEGVLNNDSQADGGDVPISVTVTARHSHAPALGINVVTALENTPDAATMHKFYGTDSYMMLSAQWRG
jgi:hypothetical protein